MAAEEEKQPGDGLPLDLDCMSTTIEKFMIQD